MPNNGKSTVFDLSKMSRRERYELASQIIADVSDEWADAEDAEQWQQENVVEYEAGMSFDELAAAVPGVNFIQR